MGSAYVGLVYGVCFAGFGHYVGCMDKGERKIAAPKECRIPIFELVLDVLAVSNRQGWRTDLYERPKDSRTGLGGLDRSEERHCRCPRAFSSTLARGAGAVRHQN